MLSEAYSDVSGQSWPWRFDNLSRGGGSVRVGEASHFLRMARGLELVDADSDKFGPLEEGCLTWWLSGSAVMIGVAMFGALLSQEQIALTSLLRPCPKASLHMARGHELERKDTKVTHG